jgi:ketosteroid isomerase-like protein
MISDNHVDEFLALYHKLDRSNLTLLDNIYHQDVIFIDPFHRIDGLPELTQYFANLYENLVYGQFEIHHVLRNENAVSIYWSMSFSHAKIKGGETISFDGNSYLEYQDEKVVLHRDYFDGAAMLYQHIPILGSLIEFVKKRAS